MNLALPLLLITFYFYCSTAIAIAIEVAVARIFQEALKYDYGIRKAYEGGTFFGGVEY